MFDETQLIDRNDIFQLKDKYVDMEKLSLGKSVLESSVSVILLNANNPYRSGKLRPSDAVITELRNSEKFKSLFGEVSEEEAMRIINAAIRPRK